MFKEIIKELLLIVSRLLIKNLKEHMYLSILLTPLFIFLIMGNITGMIPYGYTITSQFLVSLSLSLPIFVQAMFILILFNEWLAFLILLPSGVPIPITILLIGIELLSLTSRILSLAMRLTANMISGHTLLKMISSGILTGLVILISIIFTSIPASIVVPLIIMEIGIAILQGYVFIMLAISYMEDSYHLH